MKVDRPLRLCFMCDEQQIEDAEHFACQCPYYATERAECLRRITEIAGADKSPILTRAVQNSELALFLGDGAIGELPQEKQQAVDNVVCNFLKVAWRKRSKLWKRVCVEDNEWRLK